MNGVQWSAADAATATGGRAVGAWAATGVSIDTRTLVPGDLFVALPGERVDGHAFVGTALSAGAAAAMVARHATGLPSDAPRLEVDDPLAGLARLGAAARGRTEASVVAITGSVGKTGTKTALGRVLAAQGATYTAAGNLNNHIGLPLTLARLPADRRWAVLEMGMNHPDEISPLSRLARPHVALITWVALVHGGFFADEAGIADAKAEIFDGMEASGVALLPRDNAHFERLAAAARHQGISTIRSFGAHADADCRLVSLDLAADHSRVGAHLDGRILEFRIGAPGRHWAMSGLAVLLAAAALGADPATAAETLAEVRPLPGRGAWERLDLPDGSVTIIDESYNASPAAVRAALAVLAGVAPAAGGRRIAVLGDMLEMGASGPKEHRNLAGAVTAAGVDRLFAAGPLAGLLHDALPPSLRGGHAETTEALAPAVADAVRPGDVVLVKGSLGMAMRHVLAALRGRAGPARSAANGG